MSTAEPSEGPMVEVWAADISRCILVHAGPSGRGGSRAQQSLRCLCVSWWSGSEGRWGRSDLCRLPSPILRKEHTNAVKERKKAQWRRCSNFSRTLQVYNDFLAVREQVREVTKGDAVFRCTEALFLLSGVVGQFDKVPEDERLHCDAAHNLFSIQNLFSRKRHLEKHSLEKGLLWNKDQSMESVLTHWGPLGSLVAVQQTEKPLRELVSSRSL